MKYIYVGIDPGKNGAMAAVFPTGEWMVWETSKLTESELASAVRPFGGNTIRALPEYPRYVLS